MNTIPMLRGDQVAAPTCGRLAMQTTERAFWQSRMTTTGNRARPPELADLRKLAREVRRTYPRGA